MEPDQQNENKENMGRSRTYFYAKGRSKEPTAQCDSRIYSSS
ncbi:MAG: hypothetical protein JWQ79_2813 [Mucilaginibacter sp.]|nr:hypothetical protein [Mucilaginibacter sp.]